MKKLKVLNLYAGIGGNSKLWEDVDVTAVEWDQATADVYKSYFPQDEVVVGDAHQYLIHNMNNFDFVWTSPPCPTHSTLNTAIVHNRGFPEYPDMKLYQEIIVLQKWFRGLFLVENVIPYYQPLIPPSKKLHRHYYWSNFNIGSAQVHDINRKHDDIRAHDTLYGFNIKNSKIKNKTKALANIVDPELGLYILDCARGVIRKQNEKQLDLFL